MWGSTILLPILANAAAVLPLPDHIDIPVDYSTTICPNEEAAHKMLTDYYRVRPSPFNHIIDVDQFFAGQKVTGCSQDAVRTGAIRIDAVVERVSLTLADGQNNYIMYRGVMGKDEQPVIGIVDEEGNNGFPRTQLEIWKQARTLDGWLDQRGFAGDQELIFYRCESPERAVAVVDAMKKSTKAPWRQYASKVQQKAKDSGCRPARDRYFVTALIGNTYNDCGFECGIDLTALEAIDRSGLKIGLIYDASEW